MPKIVLKDIKCAECGADVAQRHIALNGLLEVVCMACYVRNVPQEDIDGALAAVEIANTAAANLRRQLRPHKLTKRQFEEARRFTDICMGREAGKEAARG